MAKFKRPRIDRSRRLQGANIANLWGLIFEKKHLNFIGKFEFRSQLSNYTCIHKYFSLIFRLKSGFKIVVWNGEIQKNANWSLKEVVGSKHCQPKIIQILICLILSRDLNSSLQILCILQIQRPLIIWRPWPKRDWLLTRLCGLYHHLCINKVSKITVKSDKKKPNLKKHTPSGLHCELSLRITFGKWPVPEMKIENKKSRQFSISKVNQNVRHVYFKLQKLCWLILGI